MLWVVSECLLFVFLISLWWLGFVLLVLVVIYVICLPSLCLFVADLCCDGFGLI